MGGCCGAYLSHFHGGLDCGGVMACQRRDLLQPRVNLALVLGLGLSVHALSCPRMTVKVHDSLTQLLCDEVCHVLHLRSRGWLKE